jgi:hypothetical protein
MTINYILNSTNGTLNVIVKGKPVTISKEREIDKYNKVLQLIKDNDEDAIVKLFDTATQVSTKLGVTITREGLVTYTNNEGQVEQLPPSLNKTLVAMYEQDESSIAPLIKFWEKVRLNPSYRVNRCLFDFIEANNIVINENGNLIMYKIVARTSDPEVFLDLYTRKIEHRFGIELEPMERKDVNDDITVTCSQGKHVCSWQYLPHYGSCVNGKDAILLCEVDPVDIVAIPRDYNNSKIRCTTYTPLSEYTYDKGEIDKVLYRGYNPSLIIMDDTLDSDLEDEDYSYDDRDDDYYLEDED